jgi:hypothetical protein
MRHFPQCPMPRSDGKEHFPRARGNADWGARIFNVSRRLGDRVCALRCRSGHSAAERKRRRGAADRESTSHSDEEAASIKGFLKPLAKASGVALGAIQKKVRELSAPVMMNSRWPTREGDPRIIWVPYSRFRPSLRVRNGSDRKCRDPSLRMRNRSHPLPPAPVTDELWPPAATSIQSDSGLTQGHAPRSAAG